MAHDDSIRELLTVYALGATAGEDSARVEAHVETCAQCREELDRLRADTALLGESVAMDPPAHLKGTVLDAIDRQRDAAATELHVPVAAEAAPAPTAQPAVIPIDRAPRFGRGARVPMLAAACIVLAVAAGVQTSRVSDLRGDLDRTQREARDQRDQTTQLPAGVLARHSDPVATNGILESSTAEVAYTAGDAPALLLHSVPAPPKGKAWQAWAIDTVGHKHSLGLAATEGTVLLFPVPSEIRGDVTSVALTLEPAGGSDQPTSSPLAYGELSV